MEVFSAIEDIRRLRWADPSAIWGFVPTMNDPKDLETYPIDLDRDLALLKKEGVDLVWMPSQDIVYPSDYETFVEVTQVTTVLEGAARPGFFRGVATVVAKLFNVFQPQRTYFGQKDAQQAIVIKRMVQDLNFNIEVIICPTVREADGLAMSSRNTKLSAAARKEATCLYRALCTAKKLFENGERDAAQLRAVITEVIDSTDMARLDYVSVAHPDTLEELTLIENRALLSLAVFFDTVRLIDNMVAG
jgi:pantoate--beta-alanine ligase